MKRVIPVLFACLGILLSGCGRSFKTRYFGVEDEALFAPKEFAQTVEAVEKAKATAYSEFQYRKIEEAMEQGRLAAMTYWACNDAEAKALLALARQSAHRAEMYHPQPSPPMTSRTISTVDPPPPPEIMLPDNPFVGIKTTSPTIILDTVYFPFDSDVFILSDPERLLSRIRTLPQEIRYEIAGYTDDKGSSAYNQRLSQHRAEAFKTYIVNQGISPDRLRAVGYGETDPVMSNSTEEGRYKNRRAEIRVLAPVVCSPEAPSYAALPAGTTIEVVHFNSASNRLHPRHQSALDKIVETLGKYPEMKIEVAGYADNTGAEEANLRLSGKRAQLVADYLIEKGLDPRRMTVNAYGEADPFVSNHTFQGRWLNRRVEIKIWQP